MNESPTGPHDIRAFSTLVSQLEDGQLHADLTTQIQDLVATLQDHAHEHGGKPAGKITLTIDMKYADGVFDVQADYKITAPKTARRRTVLWATPDNNLSRANPHQQELPLRSVDTATGAVKAI
ncbi:hypothetical protein [Telmatospirillum sp.]|uniref:hypothetical protein n=1 Tax=Telmatospirillum sp. TaxID=2079197 RepID=UPI00284DBC7E|nr:hypothetical protein [Telmatospirillum sp.]MDR3438985.1 hypothetical protein [Telmatospirillum sp.]